MKIAPTEGESLYVVRVTQEYVTTYIVAADSEKGAIKDVQSNGVPNVDVEHGERVYTAERFVRAES